MTQAVHRPSVPLRAATSVLGVVALAVLAVGCGDDAGTTAQDPATGTTPTAAVTPSPSAEPTGEPEPAGPACDEVWVDGEVLPRDYRGCQDGDRWVKAFVYPCESGQRLVTFRRGFYAAKGEVVNESDTSLAKDPEFQKAMAACGA